MIIVPKNRTLSYIPVREAEQNPVDLLRISYTCIVKRKKKKNDQTCKKKREKMNYLGNYPEFMLSITSKDDISCNLSHCDLLYLFG